MALLTCPTCGTSFDAASSDALPFCGARCKQIDLGRWLSEKQTLPYVRPLEDEDESMQGDHPAD